MTMHHFRISYLSLLLLAATVLHLGGVSDEEVLSESLGHEIDHALSCAYQSNFATNSVISSNLVNLVNAAFPTNNLTKTQIAVKLVSAQNSQGRWMLGTNDVTKIIVEILEEL